LSALLGRHFEAAEVYGKLLAQVGESGGPQNVTDAKGRAGDILGCVVRTLEKYIEPPFDTVVAWAREGIPPEAITDEENAKIRMAFYAKHNKK